jgi:hypothetical protein
LTRQSGFSADSSLDGKDIRQGASDKNSHLDQYNLVYPDLSIQNSRPNLKDSGDEQRRQFLFLEEQDQLNVCRETKYGQIHNRQLHIHV